MTAWDSDPTPHGSGAASVKNTRLAGKLEEHMRLGDRFSTRVIDRYTAAHDASHFRAIPEAVITPADAAEVGRIFAKSARLGLPITLRSGGTSLSGQAVSDSVLMDVRKNFTSIEVLDDGARVRVQPGVTLARVNAALLRHGRKLGPDPASEAACTVGGVVANNSSGMVCGTQQNSYRTIESMTFVLPSGTVVDTAAPDASKRLGEQEPALVQGLMRMRDTVRASPPLRHEIERQFAMKNTMGYGLNALLDYDEPAEILGRLMIGSEGTLAFVSEVVFRTVAIKPKAATSLLLFDSIYEATASLPPLIASGAAALELMDEESLRVAQRTAHPLREIADLKVTRHAALLVEYQASDQSDLAEQVAVGRTAIEALALSAAAALVSDRARRAEMWALRKGLYALVAGNRPHGTTALLEDVVVPVPALADTCTELLSLFDGYGYRDSVIFGHAKDGNIHFMLTDRFEESAATRRIASFTDDLVDLILGKGGSLKAEHGTGRAMAPFVRRQYGDVLYELMVDLKGLCDPRGVMNPGVLINEDPRAHLTGFETQVEIEAEADRCVECGYCEPVCPSKNLTLTPRKRIVLRREIVGATHRGEHELARELERDSTYESEQTCAVDGLCRLACPVGIDTGELVKRLRSKSVGRVEKAGWSAVAEHWGTLTTVASAMLDVAGALPVPLVTGVNKAARALAGSGIPLWSDELPRGGRRRAREGAVVGAPVRTGAEPTPPFAAAVYFPACVNTMFGAASGGDGIQAAFDKLCCAAGVSLVLPDRIDSLCCSTPWASKGITSGAASMRSRVRESLLTVSDGGRLPIVCDASSCTEGLHAAAAADELGPELRVIDAVTFVAHHILPVLPEFPKLDSIVIHPTCSTTKLGINDDLRAVAKAAANTVIEAEDWGCCAFAGDRGLLVPEFTASATAVQGAQLRSLNADAHASSNRTCELGLTRATGADYRHICEVLADLLP